jgi:predicted nuclease of predicted toxin-antitoxin system
VSPALLVNENFPAPATLALRAKGLDVLAISECCPGWDDVRVMSLAQESQRWLITFDRDYGDLIYLRGLPPPPAVILLRVPSYRPEEPAQWVSRMTADAEVHIGKFAVFDGNTLRIRSLRRTTA